MTLDKETILKAVNKISSVIEVYEHRNRLSLIIPVSQLLAVAQELRDNPDTSFDMLLDVTAIDWARPQNRFETVYFLWSNKFNARLRLKVPLEGDFPTCPSIVSVWESANWYERETFDMYGINFEGHPNLRRFYMPEGFVDPETQEPLYPLRKNFPLMGIPDSLPLPPYPERFGEVT
jgi:NADH-quinone oxidoreductase subunit C